MKKIRWYKLDGTRPIPDEIEGNWFSQKQNDSKRQVAKTKITSEVEVSTVFLSLDHGWGDEVILFETLVFGGSMDGTMKRYKTWIEAEQGHQEIVDKVRKNIKLE